MEVFSREIFAEQIAELLVSGKTPGDCFLDREQFALFFKDAGGSVLQRVNLESLFAQFIATPESNRFAFYEHVLKSSTKSNSIASFADEQDRILLQVETRIALELSKYDPALMQGTHLYSIPAKYVAEHFAIVPVLNKAPVNTAISSQFLKYWHKGADDVFAVAASNIRKRSGSQIRTLNFGSEEVESDNGDSVYLLSNNDPYEAARLLIDGWHLPLNGSPVVLLSNKHEALVTGSQNPQGMRYLVDRIEKHYETDELPPLPLTPTQSGWEHYIPPAYDPAYLPLRKAQFLYLNAIYNQQTELLNARNLNLLRDCTIASFRPLGSTQGKFTSLAVVIEGERTLIPETDEIAFVSSLKGEKKVLARACRKKIMQLEPELLVPTDCYPKRYLINGFPSRAQLAQIGISYS